MVREVAKAHQEKLPSIKKKVEQSYKYFDDNYKRYHRFKKFVYDTSISNNDASKLKALNKPNIEFNILEAYINRRIGEFIKQEPTLQVRAADGISSKFIDEKLIQTINTVEDHIREVMSSCKDDGLQTQFFKDTMGGGFSVGKVYTDYVSDLSFEQQIIVERVFDPTLCGFDPLAKDSHKGDGEYCFEIVPRTREDFEEEFGKEATKGITFNRNVTADSFNWSYKNQDGDILLEAWFYQKERKKETIAKLSNGAVILKKHYPQLLEYWNGILNRVEQAPIIIEERKSMIESIWLYRFCENKVLDVIQTNYKYLPLVFIDGNSVVVKRADNDCTYQMTRPFVYQAEGVQRLKNFAGQTIGSELETLVQHKFIVAMESIPEDYTEAYTNPQFAQVLAYNAFYDKNPELPLPPPQVIHRSETPQIVKDVFEGTDRTTQVILGSFDAQQGIVGDKISGRAIEQGALQNDATALPYLENFIKGWNRIGQILLDLIPKYYVTPRTLPTRKANGLRSYQVINDPNDKKSIDFNYDSNALQIKIEAGVNSSVQKQYNMRQLTDLMGASETFSQFINTMGIDIIVDNLDIQGNETLKERVAKFMENMQAAQEQNANKPDPMTELLEIEKQKAQSQVQLEAAKLELKREEIDGNLAVKASQVANDQQHQLTEFYKVMTMMQEKERKLAAEEESRASEMARESIQLAIDVAKHNHEIQQSNLGENMPPPAS